MVQRERETNWASQVTIVNYANDGSMQSKRLYWDQASVLKQLGILPTSMFCKANRSEVNLPVVDARIAKPLNAFVPLVENNSEDVSAEASAAFNQQVPAGLSSARANAEKVATPRTQRQKSLMSDILSEAPPTEDFRPSSKVLAQPGGRSSDIFSQEPLPLRTSVPIDPRRYQSQIDLHTGASTEDLDMTHHKKLFPSASNVSSFSLGETPEPSLQQQQKEAPEHLKFAAMKISQESIEELPVYHGRKLFAGANQSHFSFDGSFEETQTEKHVTRRDPNARSEEHLLGMRPSSRVLRAPGGGSSIHFG